MFQPLSWRHLSVYFQMSKDLVSEITAWESFIWKWHPFPLCCSLFSSWVDMWVFEVTLYILHSHMVHHEKSSFISFFFFYSVLVNQAFSYFSPNAIFFYYCCWHYECMYCKLVYFWGTYGLSDVNYELWVEKCCNGNTYRHM